MARQFTLSTIFMLVIPPLMWAANATVGRMVNTLVPPMTLNFLRWALAFVVLLPLAHWIFRGEDSVWKHWRRLIWIGLFGVGLYNTLQYLALQTSTPINVTLVGSSMPVWMMLVGRLFFDAKVTRLQIVGAVLSIAGVMLILSRGDWEQLLALRLVPGDVYMILAALSFAVYSWLLAAPGISGRLRNDWAGFLLAQTTFGLLWSGAFTTGEWMLTDAHIAWGWPLIAALLFVALGPSILAYRFWGTGVQRVGPSVASFFNNLTPLFAALMSSAFLGELPRLYHAGAFGLIMAGIVLSSRR